MKKAGKAASLRLLKHCGTIKTPMRQFGLWRRRKYQVFFYPIRWGLSSKRSLFDSYVMVGRPAALAKAGQRMGREG
jgi:hypothetical protein